MAQNVRVIGLVLYTERMGGPLFIAVFRVESALRLLHVTAAHRDRVAALQLVDAIVRSALTLGGDTESLSVAELFAYVVCAERPVQASRVATIIDEMARERRAADHVFEQMRATERAIPRLWALRLGEGAQ